MPLPQKTVPYHEKDNIDKIVDSKSTKETLTTQDTNQIKVVAQIEEKLKEYRAKAANMTVDELEDESHQSKVLGEFLTANLDPRPHEKCHAHAIVSGAHKDAAELRGVLAWLKVRIDDPDNGCWLPENTAALTSMPERLRNAIPHSRIHRYNYYFWLNTLINANSTKEESVLRGKLKDIETRIQAGIQPDYVMMKKGEGLPV